MSLATLERMIVEESKRVLRNSKLRKKDIVAWSTGFVRTDPGEVTVRLPDVKVNVCWPERFDKRPPEERTPDS